MVGLVVLSAAPARADVAFFDGTFSNSDWSASIILQAGPTPIFSATQVASGGNPGEYRRQVNDYGGPGSIVTAHLNSSAIYDPSTQGALNQVDGSFDLYLFDGGDSQAVAYGVALLQSGVYYLSFDRLALTAGWTVFTPLGLQESSFFEVSGGGTHPDFSATGAPMQFGYYVSNSTAGASPTQTDSGIDNWSLNLLTAPPQGVPVLGPLAIGSLILAIGIIGVRRAWRPSNRAKRKGAEL